MSLNGQWDHEEIEYIRWLDELDAKSRERVIAEVERLAPQATNMVAEWFLSECDEWQNAYAQKGLDAVAEIQHKEQDNE